MPERLERRQQTGNLHFLTFSCEDRNPYLASPKAALVFERSLEAVREKYQLAIFGYVVSAGARAPLTGRAANSSAFNGGRLAEAIGFEAAAASPFWLPRYHDFNVFSEEKRIEKLRYLHRNPVARGLVTEAGLWPWSSFNAYQARGQDTVRIDFRFL